MSNILLKILNIFFDCNYYLEGYPSSNNNPLGCYCTTTKYSKSMISYCLVLYYYVSSIYSRELIHYNTYLVKLLTVPPAILISEPSLVCTPSFLEPITFIEIAEITEQFIGHE